MTARRNAARTEGTGEQGIPGLDARRIAHEAVADLLMRGRTLSLDDALAQAQRRIRAEDGETGLARAIATATFRRLGYLRSALAGCLSEGLPQDLRLQALLLTGAAQVLELSTADHAAVDLSVRISKGDLRMRHLSGLVNAVLRRMGREREAILAARGEALDDNTPDWLARRWREAYGEESARTIARAHLPGAPIDLTVRDPGAGWAERLGGRSLALGSVRLSGIDTAIARLDGYDEGSWWVQDAAATLPVRLLAPRQGERIADLCAAPGGKTAQLAAAGARVLAVDRSAQRLERLEQNLSRLRLEAETFVGDALDLPEDEPFDAVLLDAPCSSTGTLRRHPDVAWTKSVDDIRRLADLQSRLLDKAARLVRPGGRLVYCTCSLEPEEGGAQIAAFLERNPVFERIPLHPDELAGHGEMIDAHGDLRTLPCHLGGAEPDGLGGLDGFFAGRLRRRG